MRRKHANETQQKLISMSFDRCGVDCVLTFEGEGRWETLLPGNEPNPKGSLKGSMDMGLCQMNWQFHFDFIFDLSQSPWLGKLSQKELDKLEHSYKWDDRTTYNKMKNEFNRLWKAGHFSSQFKDPFVQMNRCLDMWDIAKKEKRLRTTWYAYKNVLILKSKEDLLKRFELIYN